MHGLIQAFSRTNRILNSVKTYGNIVCFRNLQKATDDAIALFGDREASGVVLLKGYDAYYDGYEENGKAVPGYRDLIDELSSEFPLGQPITGEQKQKDFIKLYGNILRLKISYAHLTSLPGMSFSWSGIFRITRACISIFIRRIARKQMGTKKTSTMILRSKLNSSGRWRSTLTTF